jgi:hypothetical protein
LKAGKKLIISNGKQGVQRSQVAAALGGLIGRFKLISDSYYDSNRVGGINGKEMAVAAMFTDGQ